MSSKTHKPGVYRFFDRKIQIKNKRRFAYSVVAVVGISVSVYVVLMLSEKKIERQDALKSFLNARSAAYNFQIDTLPGLPAVNCAGMFKHPGKVRMDMGGEMRFWYDLQTGKVTSLAINAKVAGVANLSKEQIKEFNKSRIDLLYIQELLPGLCDAPAASVKKLGKCKIYGTKAVGFQFAQGETEIEFWADYETLNPLKIEYKMRYPDGTKCKIVANQIRLDSNIDGTLMDAVIPEGYTVKDVSNFSMDTEKIAQLNKCNKKTVELVTAISALRKTMEEYQSIPKEQTDSKSKALKEMQNAQNKVETLTKEVNAMKEAVIE